MTGIRILSPIFEGDQLTGYSVLGPMNRPFVMPKDVMLDFVKRHVQGWVYTSVLLPTGEILRSPVHVAHGPADEYLRTSPNRSTLDNISA